MVYTQESYSFLETIAGAADVVLNNHKLSITGCPAMDYRQIAPISDPSIHLYAPVAEVLQVQVVTPTASSPPVGTVYEIQISQAIAGGQLIVFNLIYTAQATTDTATTVCNAWRAQLALSPLNITGSGTTTLILTAETGSPVFLVNVLGNSLISAASASPAGVWAKGTTAALTAIGIPAADPTNGIVGWTSGHTYATIAFTYISDDGITGGNAVKGWNKHTLYAYYSESDYAAFAAQLQLAIGALTSGGDADPEAVAVGS